MTGAELGAARLALGVTQAELGLLVGVHGVTICRWERSGRPVPAWVAGVVQTVLEGQTRQGRHLPRLADALRVGGVVPSLTLWGTAGIMAPRPWWVWVRRSTLAPLLRASDPPPCRECRLVGGAHKLACTRGAALRQGADPERATVVNGVLLCRPCKEEGNRHVALGECPAHPLGGSP